MAVTSLSSSTTSAGFLSRTMYTAWVNGRVVIYTVHDSKGQQVGYTNEQWESIASKVSPLMDRVKASAKRAPTSMSVNLTTHALTSESGDVNLPKTETVPLIAALRRTIQNMPAQYLDSSNPAGDMRVYAKEPCPVATAFRATDAAIPEKELRAYYKRFKGLQVFEKSGPNKIDRRKNAVFIYPKTNDSNTRIFFYSAKARTLTLFDPKCANANDLSKEAKAIQSKLSHLTRRLTFVVHKDTPLSEPDLTNHSAAYCAEYVRHFYQNNAPYHINDTDIVAARTNAADWLQSPIVSSRASKEDADISNLAAPVSMFMTALGTYGYHLSKVHNNFQFVEAGGDVVPTTPAKRYIGTYRLVDQHYVFFLVDTQTKKLHYYDSMGKPLTHYNTQLSPVKTALDRQFAGYTWSDSAGHQQQRDGYNCGAYGLHMFESVITGTSFDTFKRRQISQADMDLIRRRMARSVHGSV